MSEYTEVPFEGNPSEQATLLLAAAEELGLGQEVVQTRTGSFYVPEEVRDKAFGEESDEERPRRGRRSTRKAQE